MSQEAWSDEIVDEVHKIRAELAREAGYDIRTLGKNIQEYQRKLGKKLVTPPPQKYPEEEDEILRELREARQKLLEEFDYDLDKLVKWLQQSQERHGNRLVREVPPEETED